MASHLLVEHLPLVSRLVRFTARRYHLTFTDTEEFASLVHVKLVESDCAVIRKFEGRSTLATYLAVVIERLYRRFEGLLRVLRAALEAQGVSQKDTRALVGHPAALLRDVLAESGGH
jgi:hypothetical protein